MQPHLTQFENVFEASHLPNLTCRPSQWHPETLAQWPLFVGHFFARESAMHLAINSMSFDFLASFIFPAMSIFATITTFLVGGIMASPLDCATAKAYASPWTPWHNLVGSLHASPRDHIPTRRWARVPSGPA